MYYPKSLKMKKLLLLVCSLLVFFWNISRAQVLLGHTAQEIEETYPNIDFTVRTNEDGKTYLVAKMQYGMFSYYFDSLDHKCNRCIQIPYDNIDLKKQINIYNHNYEHNLSDEWVATADEKTFYIKLTYLPDYERTVFVYSFNP